MKMRVVFFFWCAVFLTGAFLSTQRATAAESYIIFDDLTGYILEAKNENARLQVASLTKVATVSVALDWTKVANADITQLVTVPSVAVRAGGVNPVGLQPGDQLSIRDLIYCAMLASDNVAATTLAYFVGQKLPNRQGLDPVDSFVVHMNALARQLEMNRTLFLNPTGMDNVEGTKPHSTARDMAKLTRYAYREPGFAFYVAQKTRAINVLREGQNFEVTITNTNQILGQEEIDGVKTGRTAAAGDCLILSGDKSPLVKRTENGVITTPRRVGVILLKSPDRFGEGLSLMRRGWRLYDEWNAGGRLARSNELL